MINDTLLIGISLVGGFLAGGINTLAGNGSAITLGILTDLMGLPGNIANGTNRVGVLAQGITSTYQLTKNRPEVIRANKDLILVTIIGALIGVYLATIISNDQFKFFYKYMMVLMLIIVLIKPERWIKSESVEVAEVSKLMRSFSWVMCFFLGVYGGFIQLGMGVFFLAVMVLWFNKDIRESNILKVFVVGVYTIFVLAIFVMNGMIDWKAGLFLAIGQALGGWVVGKYAANNPQANKIAYYILIVVIVTVLVNQFVLQ